MKAADAKRLLRDELAHRGMGNRLTARTINFIDLTRSGSVFVKIHDWKPSPLWSELRAFAHSHDFCIEADR